MFYIKSTNANGQYVDFAGVRCDLIAAEQADFAPGFADCTECELLADALDALGIKLWRSWPTRYSKLRIIEELGELWPVVEGRMTPLEKAKFLAADHLEAERSDVETFLAGLRDEMPDIDEILARCEI